MSVGTFQSAGVRAPPPTLMPLRILNKGPEYFRPPADSAARKPSAVERLEADKLKYVKSKEVASTRQEPVRPLVSRQPLFSPGVRRALLSPNRRVDGRSPKSSLNLDILNNLINLCDSPLKSPRAEVAPWQHQETSLNSSGSTRTPNIAAVRRVDVKPEEILRSAPCPQVLLSPASPALSPDVSLCSPPCTPSDPNKKKSQLQRSKSDLSDRISRASADLERFFNYCGLDPGEMVNIGAEHFARASSDIVSAKFHSVSTPSSECAQSQFSEAPAEETAATCKSYGISIIERNARVIKWLYGLRHAQKTLVPPNQTPSEKEKPLAE
ncbi:hypothetical protein GDO86_014587 [Hymenochirus boettgeri]|uniref:Family with sequence similarity 110 member A n=1 Tax=Hymenochirus boettgeri TaxID=247094 RepID=A0A8T2JPE7_9PIPI|nr:hypothetical protein GDO86_014587 [Hymenochirus boettgeri]